ncbi:hypothetical protein DFH06DRAFT_1228609 [Mycena polygramma]|nr:hypothetical protein DFH06DRAFT_1228609 [Mycena polygramma]
MRGTHVRQQQKRCSQKTAGQRQINAGFFLIQCTSTEATELAGGKDWILNEVLRRSTALEDANPLPHNPENYILRIPENPHPLLQAMLPGPVTPAFDHATTVGHEIDQFPSVVPSPPFKVPEEPYECRQVTKLQLAKWRNKPELIYQKLFVSITDGEEEVFRLVSFADSSERARTFYVQMAEDDEAFAFSGQSFFDLLAESKSLRIVQQ